VELQGRRQTSINSLTTKVHENAINHGWWQDERSFGDIIALCHAELSEALEEYRNGHKPNETYLNGEKPEGIPTELADVVIRIMDYCGHTGIDLEKAITKKMEYNKTRPYKHGDKVI
jgi:NTP pyrophosphatase (non-canonical NTP hydrolase)